MGGGKSLRGSRGLGTFWSVEKEGRKGEQRGNRSFGCKWLDCDCVSTSTQTT